MTSPAHSRRAWTLAVLGGLLIVTAAMFDAEPLYVPGLTFVLLAGAAVAWVWLAARGIVVERTIVAPTIEEEQPLAVHIIVRAGHTVLPSGVIDEPLLERGAPLAAGHRQTSIRIAARFARRGRRVLSAPTVTVRDVFGIAARSVGGGHDHDVLVLPAITKVRLLAGGAGSTALGDRPAPAGFAAEVDLDGLRPHRPGASASRIAWAAYARSGELMERHLHPEGDSRPIVVLDPRTAPGSGSEELDAAVRATASLCVYLARRGGCSLLLPGDRRPVTIDPSLAAWPRLHVRLAVLTTGPAPALAALSGRRGTVVYIAARTLARPPRALQQARGARRVLVVPGVLEGRGAGAFAVAGCTGYDLTPTAARSMVS
ncbi:MAG: hypothetical protein JWO02_363 [Solirubrobacterales bacterium]|nr:hypothetical protein [Solirubrobacterales bacterium]